MALRVLGGVVSRALVNAGGARSPGHVLSRCYGRPAAPGLVPRRRWLVLEPVLEEALVPRRLSVSPLESWVSAQHHQHHHHQQQQEILLPSISNVEVESPVVPGREPRPLVTQSVLKIRRRKMNHHKYRKLVKRMRFRRRGILRRRAIRKQRLFERELEHVWKRAGLQEAPPGWNPPKIYHHSGTRKPIRNK